MYCRVAGEWRRSILVSYFLRGFLYFLIAVSVVVVVVAAQAMLRLYSSRQGLRFDVSDVVFLMVLRDFMLVG